MKQILEWVGISVPAYGAGAILVLILYVIQSEIRFGATARKASAGAYDRSSTIVLSLSSLMPLIGFALAMKPRLVGQMFGGPLSHWLLWPGLIAPMQISAWSGVAVAAVGLLIRLWGLLTLRDRYTRTLLVHENHKVERNGPYAFVRHPGYLGSLLCLNGIALASCSLTVFALSIIATSASYAYRIKAEDTMLTGAFGEEYEQYRRQVPAILPFAHFN